MSRIDWAGLMQMGIGGLRLSPDVFWRLTPAELAVMSGHGAGVAAMSRARFGALARAYPDGAGDGVDG